MSLIRGSDITLWLRWRRILLWRTFFLSFFFFFFYLSLSLLLIPLSYRNSRSLILSRYSVNVIYQHNPIVLCGHSLDTCTHVSCRYGDIHVYPHIWLWNGYYMENRSISSIADGGNYTAQVYTFSIVRRNKGGCR